MVTIREIADYTNLSPSTVSIVLSGKSASRNISEKTTKKILEAAKELGYSPNISARRLRNNNTKQYVSVFWANDFRAPLLFEFIKGMQQYIETSDNDIEIVLRLFTPDLLEKSAQPDQLSMYSANVICTASSKDLDYLERTVFTTPVILYNRTSEKYSNVLVDNHAIGEKAAEIFISHNKKNAVVFSEKKSQYAYSQKRMLGFMDAFNNNGGITTIINSPENTLLSAYSVVKEMEYVFQNADCIFCLHDRFAISYLNYIRNTNLISIPQNQELISVGVNDSDTYESLHIPLSIIDVPICKMGNECMRIVIDRITGNQFEVESKIVDFIYIPRETCK